MIIPSPKHLTSFHSDAPLQTLSDAALMTQACVRSPWGRESFAVVVGRHRGWLTRYLTGLTHSPQAADELAQETFVRAYLAAKRFRGDDSARSWLRAIATRLAYNRLRDARTRRRYEALAAPRQDPDGYAASEARQVLLQGLSQLPLRERHILTLRYVEELTIEDIAADLGLSISATKMRLMRARQRFESACDQPSTLAECHAATG